MSSCWSAPETWTGCVMSFPDGFPDITRPDVPLAPYTWLKVGGPAQFFVEPRSPEELAAVVRVAHQSGIPFRILGNGSNVLIPDAGVSGITLRLTHESFATVAVAPPIVRAGAGALLSHVMSESV